MVRNGGGAADSAGYHDQAGCFDVRTWDLTFKQVNELVRVCRKHGGAPWRRDLSAVHGGMDPHCHITLGGDKPYSTGAAASWRSYMAGHNGLANEAPDYEWRPSPLVTRFVKPKPKLVLPGMVQAAKDATRRARRQTTKVPQPARFKVLTKALNILRGIKFR